MLLKLGADAQLTAVGLLERAYCQHMDPLLSILLWKETTAIIVIDNLYCSIITAEYMYFTILSRISS